jgi:hypothetical protein
MLEVGHYPPVKMGESIWKIRISTIEEREEKCDRARLVMDSLAEERLVGGDGPWIVAYSAADASEAFSLCAEGLDAIEPRWIEVLDFAVIPNSSSRTWGPRRWR